MDFLSWFFGIHYLSPKEVENEIKRLTLEDSIISKIHNELKITIQVQDCQDDNIRAYYNIKQNKIIISPYGYNYKTLHEALLHEYIHAYDHKIQNLKIDTLEGLASTEIHAAKYCECRNELFFKKQKTFSKAIEAVNCSIHNHEKAYNAVNSIFSKEYQKKIPFLEFSSRNNQDETISEFMLCLDPYQ